MVGRKPQHADAPHRLREARLARPGITLDVIAEKLGSNPQTVQRVELGKIELKVRDLPRYADALGVDGAEIVGYERLFRDPNKLKLLQAYDRMPAEDREKLARMAEAMAPEADAVAISGDKVFVAKIKKAAIPPAVLAAVDDEILAQTRPITPQERDELIRGAAQLVADILEREGVDGLLRLGAKASAARERRAG